MSDEKNYAVEVTSEPEIQGGQEVVFENLDTNPNQQFVGKDAQGNEFTVSIEEVENEDNGASKTTKVSFVGVLINCWFYMTVVNNKCASAYGDKVLTFGCTISDLKFTKTNTHATLSFVIAGAEGLLGSNVWLRGTVTGSNNTVKITYDM